MAEELGSALQKRVRGCESLCHLQSFCHAMIIFLHENEIDLRDILLMGVKFKPKMLKNAQ